MTTSMRDLPLHEIESLVFLSAEDPTLCEHRLYGHEYADLRRDLAMGIKAGKEWGPGTVGTRVREVAERLARDRGLLAPRPSPGGAR